MLMNKTMIQKSGFGIALLAIVAACGKSSDSGSGSTAGQTDLGSGCPLGQARDFYGNCIPYSGGGTPTTQGQDFYYNCNARGGSYIYVNPSVSYCRAQASFSVHGDHSGSPGLVNGLLPSTDPSMAFRSWWYFLPGDIILSSSATGEWTTNSEQSFNGCNDSSSVPYYSVNHGSYGLFATVGSERWYIGSGGARVVSQAGELFFGFNVASGSPRCTSASLTMNLRRCVDANGNPYTPCN